jgi:uncharacterized membrane protein
MKQTSQRLLADPYRLLLLVLALLYSVIFTHLAWDAHAGMRTHRSDLGQIHQAVWNSSQGRWLAQTDNGFVATRLTDHVEPILVLISPVMWLWDDVRALLLLQVVAAAVGVLPLYHLVLRRCETLLTAEQRTQIWLREPLEQLARPLAFALGVAYLLAPQLQSALLTEFHAAPLAVPLILWAFWAVDARRWSQFVVAALLTALVKEEMALLAAGLGAWAIWRTLWDRPRRMTTGMTTGIAGGMTAGLAVLLLGLVWFYLATFVIVPAYAQPLYGAAESTYFQRYGALGDSATDILRSFVTQPQLVWSIAGEPPRVAYLLGLLAAFALLPLLGVEIVLLSLPLLLANLLSAYPAQYYGEFHYSAPLVCYFAVAAAYGLTRVWRPLARRAGQSSASFQHLPAAGTGAMAAMSLWQNSRTALRPLLTWALVGWIMLWSLGNYWQYGRGPLGGRYDPTPITAHHRLLARFTAQIPRAAAVTATAGVHPHMSARPYIYQFPLGLEAPVGADWALLDVTTNTDMAPGDLKAKVDEMLAGDWGIVDAADGFLLLRKAAPRKEIPEDFYSFIRPRTAPATTGAAADRPLSLWDITAEDWARWRQTKLTAIWQVDGTFRAAEDLPELAVVTPGGDTVATLASMAPPGLAWLPTTTWQAGDTIHLTTLALPLPPTFGVYASGQEGLAPAIFVRRADGVLAEVTSRDATADLGAGLEPYLGALTASAPVTTTLPDGRTLALHGWLPAATVGGGQPLNVLLAWELTGEATTDSAMAGVKGWPSELAAFVHLRHEGANVTQADGAPQWFGRPAEAVDMPGGATILHDWRQMTLPVDAESGGTWQVVVGMYDPDTGKRQVWAPEHTTDGGGDAADEVILGQIKVGPPPVPDQACALLAATCPAQPR